MSTTERDLRTGDGPDDALDELFEGDDFTAAFERAIDSAELELEIGDVTADSSDVSDTRDDLDTPGDLGTDEPIEDAVGERGASDEPVADFPVIVPATPDDAEVGHPDPAVGESVPVGDVDRDDPAVPEARVAPAPPIVDDPAGPESDDPIADEILEELRRADIDGPVVDVEPQDETASTKRRPRRSAEYDPAPVPIPVKVPRVLGRKPRVRRVTRVVRHVDPWSVFKIAIVAHLVLYVIVLTASVLLWNVAHATGTVGNVERFFESFGWDEFEFRGGEIYRAAWVGGLFAVVGLTGLAVLAATLFNLITDLVGGVRFTVLEEEVVETRVSPMRRFVIRRPEPTVPATMAGERGVIVREAVVDDSGAIDRPTR